MAEELRYRIGEIARVDLTDLKANESAGFYKQVERLIPDGVDMGEYLDFN